MKRCKGKQVPNCKPDVWRLVPNKKDATWGRKKKANNKVACKKYPLHTENGGGRTQSRILLGARIGVGKKTTARESRKPKIMEKRTQ